MNNLTVFRMSGLTAHEQRDKLRYYIACYRKAQAMVRGDKSLSFALTATREKISDAIAVMRLERC